MACHIRLASDDAKFGQPEILLAHIPGAGGTQRLPKLIGLGRAYEHLLTGDAISAEEEQELIELCREHLAGFPRTPGWE